MKWIFVLLATFTIASANEVHIANQPDRVVIYRKGAEVTFLFKANLKKGINTVVIDSMPEGLEVDKINITEKTGLSISSIIYSLEKAKAVLTPDEKKINLLKDSIQEKNEYVDDLESKSSILLDEYNLIRNYKTDNKDFGVDKLVSLAAFYSKRLNELKIELATKKKQKDKARVEITAMQNRLSMLTTGIVPKTNMQYKFNITAENSIATDFKLVFYMQSAGWIPNYEVRVKSINSPIVFNMKAQYWVNNSKDWENVELEFSSRDPNKQNNLARLNPIYIENPANYFKKGAISNNSLNSVSGYSSNALADVTVGDGFEIRGARTTDTQLKVEKEVDFEAPEVASSEVINQSLNVAYKIKEKITILAKEDSQTIKVMDVEVPASYEYLAIPRNHPNAFLLAKIANYGSYNLTQGEAKVYFEGSYVGNTKINPQSIDDTLTISLGRDEDIQVRKQQINEFTSTKFLSSKNEMSFGNKISIKNNKATNIQIKIQDQIPISKFDGAEVKIDELSNAIYDQRTGILTWKIEVDKNEKKDFLVKYKVTAPNNAIIPR